MFHLTESFLQLLGLGLLTVIAFYVVDRTQTRHSLHRNFPVLARFRYPFEEVDLSDGDWADYDVEADAPVALSDIETKVELVR
mgnify:CR=1 FL=1